MSKRNGPEILRAQWAAGSRACVGLDPLVAKLPTSFSAGAGLERVMNFCFDRVDQVAHVTGAIKPNMAFFGQFGWRGMRVLTELVDYIHRTAPQVLVIGDGKRGDIGKSNVPYLEEMRSYGFDACTLSGYFGVGALQPFIDAPDMVLFVLCKTSNPESADFQDLWVHADDEVGGSTSMDRLYERFARRFAAAQKPDGALIGFVTGATYPAHIASVRALVGPDAPLLIPGYGDQAGDLQKAVAAAGSSCLVNSSGGVIYDKEPRVKAIQLHEGIAAGLSPVA